MKTADSAVYLMHLHRTILEQCPLLQVCVCTWIGQMQRTHFTAGYTLYNCACDKKNIILFFLFFFFFFFFTKPISDYGKMLKYQGKSVNRYIGRSLNLSVDVDL